MKTKLSHTVAAALAVALFVPVATLAASKVTFDNQSGKPAFVKLVGPTTSSISVENGKKESLSAAPGHYFIKVRYGTADAYSYSKGDEFDVKDTATAASDITITLHTVVAGNYGSQSISAAEFGSDNASASRETAASKTQGATLKVKYPGMDATEIQDFKPSFAFRDTTGNFVYLVFRNYESPLTSFKAEPTEGKAQLLIILQKMTSGPREKPTVGTYEPFLYPKGILNPIGSLLLRGKNNEEMGVNGCYWTAKKNGKTDIELLKGIVTITELGSGVGGFVKGTLKLDEATLPATGDFSIPLVETPKDY